MAASVLSRKSGVIVGDDVKNVRPNNLLIQNTSLTARV
jgi:fructose-bisphosphate aldolase, class II